jgi:branched-chain amino acid transport system permease protein
MLVLQQLGNALALSGVYALVAVAFTLSIGVLNFLNFTIPAVFMIAAMVVWAMVKAGFSWWVAAFAAILAACLAELLIERFTYRYLKARFGDATEHALPLVSSLGFLILFQNLALIAWGSDGHTFAGPFKDANLRFEGLILAIPQLASLAVAIAIVAGLKVLIDRTSTGRAIRCIAENPDAATLVGIDVAKLVPVVFIAAGLVAGIAGVLFAVSYLQVSALVGDRVGTKAIAAMVIGGIGNVWGAIAGGLLVGIVEVLAINYFTAEAVNVAVWGVLLLVLFVRPTGLFGRTAFGKGKF